MNTAKLHKEVIWAKKEIKPLIRSKKIKPMKRGTRTFMVLLVLLVPLVFPISSFAVHQITPWLDNKKGAVSLTFDDGYLSQYTLVIPALNARGFKGTFSVITGAVGSENHPSWNSWRDAASMGHEIVSHTKIHPRLSELSLPQIQDEVAGSKAVIEAQIPSEKCVILSYPYGDYNDTVKSVAETYYIAARGTRCELNGAPHWFSDVRACEDSLHLDQMEAMADAAEQQGKWFVSFMHDLAKIGYGYWDMGWLNPYLDYLKGKDNLWVAPLGAVVKYLKERGSATLSVVSSSSDQIVLSLTDTLDDGIYDQPLTIRSEIPSSWAYVNVQQGSSLTTVKSAVEGTTTVIYYNAVPDRGLITLEGKL